MRKRSAPAALMSSRGRLFKPKLWHDGTKLCGYGLDMACGRSAMHSECCKLALAADQDGCAPSSRDGRSQHLTAATLLCTALVCT